MIGRVWELDPALIGETKPQCMCDSAISVMHKAACAVGVNRTSLHQGHVDHNHGKLLRTLAL